ncbi:hypothetical protein HG537_0C00250 [Torulaspora globosa]|uniref:Protein YTP1-like C-terminal domain-containing protein n=1 Tax=Torulaspora globosa TaxID=48254 RepID=A0A7H9HNM7_9SACH|nr:hypothetical protein HG537_0C00250 [Torulaspora sp. CBS 2947]
MSIKRFNGLVLSVLFLQAVAAMEMPDGDEYTRPNIVDAGPKTLHWITSLLLLLVVPSFATALAFAGKIYSSVFLQVISGVYAVLEALILRFNDGDGVENRTSRGSAWSLMILTWVSILVGGLATGSGLLAKNPRMQKIISHTGEAKLSLLHRALSFATVLNGWVKLCLAPVAMFGFCREKHTGQCIAHGIMGSAFVLYGFIYTTVLVVPWLRNSQASYSQDHIDSWVMCIWGIVNTFTEHRWGREDWSMSDYQHTIMGVIWWCGGILGIFLSRKGRRTFVPSLIIIFTGWAMSEHSQHLYISTKVHYVFGLVLMTGGALRIVEISFLLKDERAADKIYSFQYLAPFCLVCAGIVFMGANEEQLILVLRLGADHSAYILLLGSAAFMVYFWMLSCLEFYLHLIERSQNGFLTKYSNLENAQSSQDYELEVVSQDIDPN